MSNNNDFCDAPNCVCEIGGRCCGNGCPLSNPTEEDEQDEESD